MTHRRRNPSLSIDSYLTLGIIAGAGYVFYKYVLPLIKGLGNAAGAAGDAINKAAGAVAAPIADAYVAITAGPGAQVQNSVILSTGEEVPMQDISDAGGFTSFKKSDGSRGTYFSWNSATYVMTGARDANGSYSATLAPYGMFDPGW